MRTKLDGDRHFIHFLQTEHIYTLTWSAQFYILISWVTSWKAAVPLGLTQLCLYSDDLVFVCFWTDVYVAIALPVFWSSPSLRHCEALRSHINILLLLAFLHYKCIWVYSISSAHITWIFPANFTYSFSVERPVSQSLLFCIWRWIWNSWIQLDSPCWHASLFHFMFFCFTCPCGTSSEIIMEHPYSYICIWLCIKQSQLLGMWM